MRDNSTLTIYHRSGKWLALVFLAPSIWLLSSLAGHTSQVISDSDTTAALVVALVLMFVTLLCFKGESKFYFDSEQKEAIDVRKSLFGTKIVKTPFCNIQSVTTRKYQRNKDGHPMFQVGITERDTLFGVDAIKFTSLRSFGHSDNDLACARNLAKEISDFSGIKYIDESDFSRVDIEHHSL